MSNNWYHLPTGEYSPTFLKSLAIAVHIRKLEPSELEYWFTHGWTQKQISVELYNRCKPEDKPLFTVETA